MEPRKCRMNTAHILRQIINERDNPLSIVREAISNSKDANATFMKIIIKKDEKGRIDFFFLDNGTGMTGEELSNFFNIGYSKKKTGKIGEKGLGTKLYFNCEKIIVETTSKSNDRLKGALDNPIAYLRKGWIPKFVIEECNGKIFDGFNTRISLINVNIQNERDILWGSILEHYVLWRTAAGSIVNYFQKTQPFEVRIEKMFNGKTRTSTISEHIFPDTNICDNPDNYAHQFDPFEFEIENGKRRSKVQVIGSIAGAEGHIVKDRRIKKQFKGFFLCKDFFIVKDINKDIFGGGTGEWQNMHILVNCQDVELSMGREGFIDKGEGTVFYELIKAIKEFKNCILRGNPFEYNDKLIEQTQNFAGKGYVELKGLKNNHTINKIKSYRSIRLMQLQNSKKISERYGTSILYEPNNKISTYSLFLELLGKELLKDSFTIYDANIEDKNISLLMQKNNGGKNELPFFYTVEHVVDKKNIDKLKGRYQGLICWETKNLKEEDLTHFKETIIVKDMLR